MAFTDYEINHKETEGYPILANEASIEGSFKRFKPMPGPLEVFNYAMIGLPRYTPLTNEPITLDGKNQNGELTGVAVEDYLVSAVTEIEQSLGCDLSEVTHFQSFDYIDGMFTNNFMGLKLMRWPATEITSVKIKYPHANTNELYQTYTIPSTWISLRHNKMNVVAAVGSVSVQTDSPAVTTSGGIFTYITGFTRGAYQPDCLEVTYKSGFSHDKLPAHVSDLIKTWAAHRYLTDLQPILFPSQNVNVGIDGISQGTSIQVAQLLQIRLDKLEQKKEELKRSFKKGFGRTIGASFVGA